MKQPEGFEIEGHKNKVLTLNKAVHGLKQSSRVWYKEVEIVLNELGYKTSKHEPCVFMKCWDNLYTIIALYVDDYLVFSNDKTESKTVKQTLSSRLKI